MRKLMIGTSVMALCAGFAIAPNAAEMDRQAGSAQMQLAQASGAPTVSERKTEGDMQGASPRVGTATGDDRQRGAADMTERDDGRGTAGAANVTPRDLAEEAEGDDDIPTTAEMKTEGDTKGSSPRVGTATGSDMPSERAADGSPADGQADVTPRDLAEEAEGDDDIPTTAEMKDEGDMEGSSARVGTATGGDTAGAARGDAPASAGTGVPAATALRTGMTAMTMDGEEVGTVQDVVRDTQGVVSALIVRTNGGLLGIGKSNVEVPIEDVQVMNDAVTIAMTEDQFAELPDHEG